MAFSWLESPTPATHVEFVLRRLPIGEIMPLRAPRVYLGVPMSMPSGDHAVFPARLSALPETAAFARDFCERNSVSHDDALRLMLIIEELFTNTVQHGYRSETDAPIRVTLGVSGAHVTVLYEDAAPAYDPLALIHVEPSTLNESLERRPLGGLGSYLLGQLVVAATYAYEQGTNRLWLTMPREGAASRDD